MMLEGNFSELERFFDSKRVELLDQIELAKGDKLRSAKNHYIAACGIICQVAIDGGVEYEYAKTLSDKYILNVESITSRGGIFTLWKEMILRYTESILIFSHPNYSITSKKVIQILMKHFFEKITLEEMAKKLHVSPSHLSKKLKRETGMSFHGLLNKIRIDEGKHLLLHTDKSILEVAVAVGFNYQKHFGKVFKQIVGVSPYTFRQQIKL